jgi:hypothetical protein
MNGNTIQLILAALAGWLVPGAGHWLLGMRKKAVLYLVLILGTFLAGLVVSEFHAVDYERHPIYFFAYVFNALPTLIAALATSSLEVTRYIEHESLGLLYCSVASLLNFLAVLDVFNSAERGSARSRERGATP